MKTLLSTVAILAMITTANAQFKPADGSGGLGAQDIKKVIQTYKANELRFHRDYAGRMIDFQWSYFSASEALLGEGYNVEFGVGTFGNNVFCRVADQPTLNKVVEWNPGQMVHVRGTIDDVWFGSLYLKDCELDAATS